MRTKKEILNYIDSQPWGNKFYKYAFESECEIESFDETIIDCAFSWVSTEEGMGFWSKIAKTYRNWYNAKEHAVTSWEEYCEKVPVTNNEYYYSEYGILLKTDDYYYNAKRDPIAGVGFMPKEYCEAFHAYMKLVQLKAYWDKDYNYSEYIDRYKLSFLGENIMTLPFSNVGNKLHGFYFPTKEYAEKFYSTFEDLFKIAKPIL